METRQQKISRFISSSRAEMQFGPLEANLHNSAVREWLDRTRTIAEEFLDECYQMAMDIHATRSPLIPRELYDQWLILRQRGLGKRSEREEKTCRFWCSDDGWIIVDFNGDTVRETYKVNLDYTYAKPCPDHRLKGVRFDGRDPLTSGLPRPQRVETMFESSRKQGQSSAGFADFRKVAAKIIEAIEENQ